MRSQLLEQGNVPPVQEKPSNRYQSSKAKGGSPTEMELGAIKKWEETDRVIDDNIEELTNKVIAWKNGVIETGKLIDDSDKKILELTDDVDKIN